MHRLRRVRPLALSALLACVTASVAQADWLVMRNGARLETQGAWSATGRLLRFTLPNGTLASLRASEVDLEASAKATAEAQAQPAAAAQPSPARKAVLEITDQDVAHVTDEPAAAAAPGGDKAAAEGAAVASPEGAVAVQGWQKVALQAGSGMAVYGSVKNNSRDTASNIAITVNIFDSEGNLLTSEQATPATTILPPGQSTNFKATFPGMVDFDTARFRVTSRGFKNVEPPAAGSAPPSSR